MAQVFSDTAIPEWIMQASQQEGIRPDMLRQMIAQESNYNPKAVSPVGAVGMGQLMPGTARDMGVKDPYNPKDNIFGSAKYLGGLMDEFGDEKTAMAGYNAGPSRARKYGADVPFKETQGYVAKYANSPAGQSDPTSDNPASFAAADDTATESYSSGGMAAAPDAPATGGKKKSDVFMKTVLPLLFRIGLPAVTGAVLGGKLPMGSLGGALSGLTAGGSGFLGDQFAREKEGNDMATEGAKLQSDTYWKGKKQGLDEAQYAFEKDKFGKTNSLAETTAAEAARHNRESEKIAANKETRAEDQSEIQRIKVLEKMNEAFQGKPLDASKDEDRRKMKSAILALGVGKNKDVEDSGFWGTGIGAEEGGDLTSAWIDFYNQKYHPQNVASASSDTAAPTQPRAWREVQ